MQCPRPQKLARVAADLGYESESSFSAAFKRFMAVSPGAARTLLPVQSARGQIAKE